MIQSKYKKTNNTIFMGFDSIEINQVKLSNLSTAASAATSGLAASASGAPDTSSAASSGASATGSTAGTATGAATGTPTQQQPAALRALGPEASADTHASAPRGWRDDDVMVAMP